MRQYRNKFKSVRTLAMAGIERDDCLMKWCNARVENGDINVTTEIKSDEEDNREHNKVAYLYIDNELFNNEH